MLSERMAPPYLKHLLQTRKPSMFKLNSPKTITFKTRSHLRFGTASPAGTVNHAQDQSKMCPVLYRKWTAALVVPLEKNLIISLIWKTRITTDSARHRQYREADDSLLRSVMSRLMQV